MPGRFGEVWLLGRTLTYNVSIKGVFPERFSDFPNSSKKFIQL